MACACGYNHTITLSADGTVHSFGWNMEGVLGLGHNKDVLLPAVNTISCGFISQFVWIMKVLFGHFFAN